MKKGRALSVYLVCLAWVLPAPAFLSRGGAKAAQQTQAAQEKPDPVRAMTFRQVLLILRDGDSFQACEYVNSLGQPAVVARRYTDLLQDFFWQQHDVPQMVMFGRAGIQHTLTAAAACAKEDPAVAKKLLTAARTMAYHLAVNTWPGWDDQNVELTGSDTAAGQDAARLNLRLAAQLGSGADVLAGAHWLAGAHYLAGRQREAAVEELAAAVDKFREAKKPAHTAMALGYIGIAKMTHQPTREEGKKQLDQAVAALEKLDNDEARSFVDQLTTAAKVFVTDTEP